MYIGYFDEFGHNGAYISRNDPNYKTHPVFGIGGFIIPADNSTNHHSRSKAISTKLSSAQIGSAPY